MEERSDLNSIIQILLNANNPNQEISSSAQQEIYKMMGSPPEIIPIFCIIICNPQAPLPAVQLAIILISQMMRPSSINDLSQIRQCFLANENLSSGLKNVLEATTSHSNPTIRNYSANIFAQLFLIEEDQQPFYLTDLANKIYSQAETPIEKFGALKAFYEILQIPEVDFDFSDEHIKNALISIFRCCVGFINLENDDTTIDVEVRLIAAKSISICLTRISSLFIDNEPFDLILSALPNSFQIANRELFGELIQIMTLMFINGYHIIPKYVNSLFEYDYNCLILPDIEYREKGLNFWYEIAKFEYNETIKYKRIKSSFNLISSSMDPILIYCAEALQSLNLSEILDKASLTYDFYITIQKVLDLFFKCDSPKVFAFITDYISTHLSESISENNSDRNTKSVLEIHNSNLYVLLCLIYAIINDKTIVQVNDFILLNFSQLLNSLSPTNPLAVQDISLRIISKYIKYYSKFVKNSLFNSIIQILTDIKEDFNSLILVSYLNIISIIFLKKEDFGVTINYQINNNLEFFIKIVISLFEKNYKVFNDDLLNASTLCLCDIIYKTSINQNLQIFANLFTFFEEKLRTVPDILESENVRYAFQIKMCTIIGSLGQEMATNNDVCQRAFNSLIRLMQNPHHLIYEEAMLSVSSFIPAIGDLLPLNIISFLIENVAKSISSTSVQTIHAASILLIKLVNSIPQKVSDVIPDAFHALTSCILNHPEMRDCHFSLLSALSTMFLKIDPKNMEIFKDEFLNLIIKIENVLDTLNMSSPDCIRYANNFYEALSLCFMAYIKAFAPDLSKCKGSAHSRAPPEMLKEEEKNLNHLLKYSRIINSIPPIDRSDDLLHSYILLVRAFTQKCARRHNQILNKINIKSPISRAMKREHLEKEARELINMMEVV
ncbi:hypothetical protein TRFO_26117 [Tritrichomonas foetus]|uniref:Importin N-terminal domain-containing protein n=1 Tax=Tritrichomonas foetus TaxID=1144522 RepID=A0A1J4K3E8_9EUKA|nr:hypothetical protein TRFO_26117 [Tritrichomonas foetus]|eukprot:OHT05969.1 hypothetical protein TRFO_26117 [Tritrichomonas foetus]